MATTKEITDKQLSDLWDKNGAFFAFSNTQFAEKKKEGVIYTNMHHGLICPKENVQAVLDGMDEIFKNDRERDIEENGIEQIIYRELANHEAWYTYDIQDTMDALIGYPGVTEELVWEIHRKNAHKFD